MKNNMNLLHMAKVGLRFMVSELNGPLVFFIYTTLLNHGCQEESGLILYKFMTKYSRNIAWILHVGL